MNSIKVALFAFIIILVSCGSKKKTDMEHLQGVWINSDPGPIEKVQIKEDKMVMEFSSEGSKPDLATFTIFEKGEKKWISVLLNGDTKAEVLEYKLAEDSFKIFNADGSPRIRLCR